MIAAAIATDTMMTTGVTPNFFGDLAVWWVYVLWGVLLLLIIVRVAHHLVERPGGL